jgi:hypothetical protein
VSARLRDVCLRPHARRSSSYPPPAYPPKIPSSPSPETATHNVFTKSSNLIKPVIGTIVVCRLTQHSQHVAKGYCGSFRAKHRPRLRARYDPLPAVIRNIVSRGRRILMSYITCAVLVMTCRRIVLTLWRGFARANNPSCIPYSYVFRRHWSRILVKAVASALSIAISRRIAGVLEAKLGLSGFSADVSRTGDSLKEFIADLESLYEKEERYLAAEILRSFRPETINILFSQHEAEIAASVSHGGGDGLAILKLHDIGQKNLLLMRSFGCVDQYSNSLKGIENAPRPAGAWDGKVRRQSPAKRLPSGRRKYDSPSNQVTNLRAVS